MRNTRLCGSYELEIQELTGFAEDEPAGFRCTRTEGHVGNHWAVVEGILLAEWEAG